MGRHAFQDFDLLVGLRNFVMHMRPERRGVLSNPAGTAYDQHKLTARLCHRAKLEVIADSEITTVVATIRRHGVEKWAYRAVHSILTDVVEWFLPDEPIAKHLAGSLKKWRPGQKTLPSA
jgi:hypothetical protein